MYNFQRAQAQSSRRTRDMDRDWWLPPNEVPNPLQAASGVSPWRGSSNRGASETNGNRSQSRRPSSDLFRGQGTPSANSASSSPVEADQVLPKHRLVFDSRFPDAYLPPTYQQHAAPSRFHTRHEQRPPMRSTPLSDFDSATFHSPQARSNVSRPLTATGQAFIPSTDYDDASWTPKNQQQPWRQQQTKVPNIQNVPIRQNRQNQPRRTRFRLSIDEDDDNDGDDYEDPMPTARNAHGFSAAQANFMPSIDFDASGAGPWVNYKDVLDDNVVDNNNVSAAPVRAPQRFSRDPNSRNSGPRWTHPDDQYRPGSRLFFDPFMDPMDVDKGLANRSLFQGQIRINPRKAIDAYVTCDQLDADIFICGNRARNRAMDGDTVVIQLLDVEQVWQERNDRDDAHRAKRKALKLQEQIARGEAVPDSPAAADDDDQEKSQQDDPMPKFAGKVVRIRDFGSNRTFAGVLSCSMPGNGNNASYEPMRDVSSVQMPNFWFKPNDRRVPLVLIKHYELADNIIAQIDSYKTILVEVSVVRWPITSMRPHGRFIQVIGEMGDHFAEQHALCTENNIYDAPFDDVIIRSLNKLPKYIPDREFEVRRDLRHELVFSIDPEGAKDLDDALHIKQLDDGEFEVGVHIADVTFYVQPATPLDTEAKKRGTTTYLVNRAIPMLPPMLCETLCSLTPLDDKLTYSVIWRLDAEGQVLDTWIGRTIIRSRAQLSYEQAQAVIDGGSLPGVDDLDDFEPEDVVACILGLYKLSTFMRKRRFDDGALSMRSVKLKFVLDTASERPISVHSWESKASNHLIEEFMLLANMSVAEKLATTFPEEALLRRHELPIERRMVKFAVVAKSLGYDMDVSSAAGLQASFDALEDPGAKEALLVLAIRMMKRATYFCSGSLATERFLHYALNARHYTHFTSPIRRYADIIVHRQLTAALTGQDIAEYYNKALVQRIAVMCNRRKDYAKNAQDQDSLLNLVDLLLQGDPDKLIIEQATVIHVGDHAMELYLPKYGEEARVSMSSLPLRSWLHKDGRLHLFWQRPQQEEQAQTVDDDNAMELAMQQLSLKDDGSKEADVSIEPVVLHPPELDPATRRQTVRLLTSIDVLVVPDKTKSPPRLHLTPIYPF